MTPYALPVGKGGVNRAMHGIALQDERMQCIALTKRAHAMHHPYKTGACNAPLRCFAADSEHRVCL